MSSRWTDPVAFEAECDLVGPLSAVRMSRHGVVFPRGGEALATLLDRLCAERAHRVFTAVTEIERVGERVDVRVEPGREPALQTVEHRLVACHLHGVVARDGVPS